MGLDHKTDLGKTEHVQHGSYRYQCKEGFERLYDLQNLSEFLDIGTKPVNNHFRPRRNQVFRKRSATFQ